MPLSLTGAGDVTGLASINTTVSSTELGYLDGVTSALQTQINANLPGMQLVTAQTFSGVSSISVNSCFSASFENYRILLTGTTYSGSGAISTVFRLRASGTDNSSANYRWGRIYGGATSGGGTNWSDTSFFLAGTSAVVNHQASFDVYGPQVALPTAFTANSFMEESATSGTWAGVSGGRMTVSTQYDGITILLFGSATFSGTLRIYGYRNS